MTDKVKDFFHKKAKELGFTSPCRCCEVCYNDNLYDEDNDRVDFFVKLISVDNHYIKVNITYPGRPEPVSEVWHMS